MFSIRKPTFSECREYLRKQESSRLTYDAVHQTRRFGQIPSGFTCGYRRVPLQAGRRSFLAAKDNLRDWKMFPSSFADLIWPVPLEPGRVVATLYRAPGFWILNPSRILYAFDESIVRDGRMIDRFGFAYGTVGDHLVAGEERFAVEYDHADESVWYEIYSFSRANHRLAKLAYPYVQFQQFRFRHVSGRAMQDALVAPAIQAQPVPSVAAVRRVPIAMEAHDARF